MADSQEKRQKRFSASQKEKGLVTVAVWVPKERVAELKALAAEWRSK